MSWNVPAHRRSVKTFFACQDKHYQNPHEDEPEAGKPSFLQVPQGSLPGWRAEPSPWNCFHWRLSPRWNAMVGLGSVWCNWSTFGHTVRSPSSFPCWWLPGPPPWQRPPIKARCLRHLCTPSRLPPRDPRNPRRERSDKQLQSEHVWWAPK